MKTSQQQLANLSMHFRGKEGSREVAREVYKESQRRVPVDTGDLKRSGDYGVDYVSYSKGYATFVEYGTAKMMPNPFLRTSMKKVDMRKVADRTNEEIRRML